MNPLFSSMPGIKVPISKVNKLLPNLWQREAPYTSNMPPSHMNFVLHFGAATSIENAHNVFEQSIRFSKKHPCRIIVLCPQDSTVQKSSIEGKLFCQCYLKENALDHTSFCEALILGYPTESANLIETQFSLWLENDLPTYYWPNKVSLKTIEKYYLNFVTNCERLIFDSSVETDPFDLLSRQGSQFIRDLVYDRLLPMRQFLGQFLSSYPPATLVQGLKQISVHYQLPFKAEAQNLLNWNKSCITQCIEISNTPIKPQYTCCENNEKGAHSIGFQWIYERPDKFFNWSYCYETELSTMTSKLESKKIVYPLKISLLNPVDVLSSALFN